MEETMRASTLRAEAEIRRRLMDPERLRHQIMLTLQGGGTELSPEELAAEVERLFRAIRSTPEMQRRLATIRRALEDHQAK